MKFQHIRQIAGHFQIGRILVVSAALVLTTSGTSSRAQTPAQLARTAEATILQCAAYSDPRSPCRYDNRSPEIENLCYCSNITRLDPGEPRYCYFLLNSTSESVTQEFVYQMKLRNDGDKTIQSVEWDYLFIDVDTQQEVARHQFSSKQPVQPRKSKIITEFSPALPTKVISLKALSERSEHPFSEKVFIRRVTYTDGSSWKPSANSP
jgi:hypothetical protein